MGAAVRSTAFGLFTLVCFLVFSQMAWADGFPSCMTPPEEINDGEPEPFLQTELFPTSLLRDYTGGQSLSGGFSTQGEETVEVVSHELTIYFKSGTTLEQKCALYQEWDFLDIYEYDEVNAAFVVFTQAMTVAQAVQLLRQNPIVEDALPDDIGELDLFPNDLCFSIECPVNYRQTPLDEQWYYQDAFNENYPTSHYGTRAVYAWDKTTGNPNYRIVVADTGVDREHPDLVGRLDTVGISCVRIKVKRNHKQEWVPRCWIGAGLGSYDCPPQKTDCKKFPETQIGHGTMVAGVAAAATNNAYRLAGGSWQGLIFPIRVAHHNCGNETYQRPCVAHQSLIQSLWILRYSTIPNIYTMNISLGFDLYQPSERFVLYILRQTRQTLTVAAAGNSGSMKCQYPACYFAVLSVAALRKRDSCRWERSNYGYPVAASYGINITTLYLSSSVDDIREGEGTSFAAPQVAALAHLIKSVHPEWLPDPIEQRIYNTSENHPWNDVCDPDVALPYGPGQIDFCRAVWDASDWPAHCQQ